MVAPFIDLPQRRLGGRPLTDSHPYRHDCVRLVEVRDGLHPFLDGRARNVGRTDYREGDTSTGQARLHEHLDGRKMDVVLLGTPFIPVKHEDIAALQLQVFVGIDSDVGDGCGAVAHGPEHLYEFGPEVRPTAGPVSGRRVRRCPATTGKRRESPPANWGSAASRPVRVWLSCSRLPGPRCP